MAMFRKLADGTWGLKGYAHEMIQGNRVRVETRSGTVVFKYVGAYIGPEDGQNVHYEQGKEPAQRPLTYAHPVQHGSAQPSVPPFPTTVQPTMPVNAPVVPQNGSNGHHAHTPVVSPPVVASVPTTPATPVPTFTPPTPSNSVFEPAPLNRPDHSIKDGDPAPSMTPDALEAQARRMGELVMIDYDIIEDQPHIDPCPYLYAAGFYRSSKSCWVGEKSRIPWRLLHRMQELGHTWDYTGLKTDETVRKISQAIVKITEEIRSLEVSINKTVATAQKHLEEATETNADGEKYATLKTQEKHRKAVEQAIKKCQERLEKFMTAAKAFGIDGIVMTERRRMSGIVSGMKRVAEQRVMAWLSLVEKAKDTPMAEQIESGDMPVGIAMDYLQDEGINVDDEMDTI